MNNVVEILRRWSKQTLHNCLGGGMHCEGCGKRCCSTCGGRAVWTRVAQDYEWLCWDCRVWK